MTEPRLIIRKRPRGEYEIGTYTEDGAIVAHVSVREGRAPDSRADDEKEEAAVEQAKRLVEALEQALASR